MTSQRSIGHIPPELQKPSRKKRTPILTAAKRRDSIKGRSLAFGIQKRALPVKWPLIGLAGCLLIYILRLDRVAGEFIDDGWYILIAKALATGRGFTLINSPSPGMMPYYPPAFPALLSLVFRAFPQFPANVLLMKALSVTAIMLAGGLTYYYFVVVKETTHRFAMGIAFATLLTPGIVFLATSTVMSECGFIFLQTATIVLVEISLRTNRKSSWFLILAASAFAAVAFLTRYIAIGLLAAVLVYLLIHKQLLKALCFSSLVSLLVFPWFVYSQNHASTEAQISTQKFITKGYTSQFTSQWNATVVFGSLLRRVTTNLQEIGDRDVGGILLSSLYRDPSESGEEVLGMYGRMGMDTDTIIVSLVLSGLCLWGFIVTTRRALGIAELNLFLTLLIILSWSGFPFRLLLPFAPFLIFYTLEGLKNLPRLTRRSVMRAGPENGRRAGHAAGLFLLLIIGLSLYDHVRYVLCKFHFAAARIGWIDRYDESKQLLQWLSSHVDPATVIATENAPLVNLYTGLKTLPDLDPVKDRDELRKKGANLFVHISPHFASPVLLDDPRFHILYYTSQSHFYVLSLDP